MTHKHSRPPPGGRADDDPLDPAAWPQAVASALDAVRARQAQAAASATEAPPEVVEITEGDLDAAVALWREVMPAPLRDLLDAAPAEQERRTA